MAPKVCLSLILLLLFLPVVFALEPIQPIAQTEQIIIYQHEQTRSWCQDQWDKKEKDIKQSLEEEKNNLAKMFSENLWLDRILSFILIFIATFLAFSLRSYLNHKRTRKLEGIEKLEKASTAPELPELSEPPIPKDESEIIKDFDYYEAKGVKKDG